MKAIINFSDYSAAELGPAAQVIHNKLSLNAAAFPALPVTLAALQAQITDYNAKLVARASQVPADVLAWRSAPL